MDQAAFKIAPSIECQLEVAKVYSETGDIAITGRHSMAITKKHGPCHRLSIVYTDIENLGEFMTRDTEDMKWVREFCKKCGKCIRKCPYGAIMQEPVILDGFNPTRIDYEKCCKGFLKYGHYYINKKGLDKKYVNVTIALYFMTRMGTSKLVTNEFTHLVFF